MTTRLAERIEMNRAARRTEQAAIRQEVDQLTAETEATIAETRNRKPEPTSKATGLRPWGEIIAGMSDPTAEPEREKPKPNASISASWERVIASLPKST